MEILRYFLLFVEVVTCLLLVGVILLQKTKGQGLGMAFGAGVGEALFGAQAGNVLTKTTVVLAVIFLLNTTILSLLGASHRSSGKSVADRIPITKPVSTQPSPSTGANTEAPAGGIPAGQTPVQMPVPGSQSAANQPVIPVTSSSSQPSKNETAPVTPLPAGTGQAPSK
ncbi:MAG: preprotein translocase subunit SecG [Kiritimatiellae bacterium]|nr:preprotein translocase subunit SecG [Kiritimatiellia bacterium]MDD5520664.1 preprotein translocase subunit SecG [Kiritimatiellia bacterium]